MSVVSIASGGHRARVQARRDALVEANLDLVHSIAKSVAQSLPCCFEIDDLVATGYLGLIKAATNYRPRMYHGTPFSAYARPVIRGAIFDSVRRGKYEEATRPSREDLYEAGGVRAGGAGGQRDAGVPGIEPLTAVPDYETDLDAARLAERLGLAVAELPARLQTVVRMHYAEDERLPAVADALDVGKSRASQLHMEAVRRLRERLA